MREGGLPVARAQGGAREGTCGARAHSPPPPPTSTLRINVAIADLDLAFGEHAFYKAISRSVRAGDV